MSNPESQLDTWSRQGAVATAKATHESIRNALTASTSAIRGRDYEVYLQGSYKNDTDIRGDSDVDVVMQLNDAFGQDLDALSPAEGILYLQRYSALLTAGMTSGAMFSPPSAPISAHPPSSREERRSKSRPAPAASPPMSSSAVSRDDAARAVPRLRIPERTEVGSRRDDAHPPGLGTAFASKRRRRRARRGILHRPRPAALRSNLVEERTERAIRMSAATSAPSEPTGAHANVKAPCRPIPSTSFSPATKPSNEASWSTEQAAKTRSSTSRIGSGRASMDWAFATTHRPGTHTRTSASWPNRRATR